MKNTLPCRHEHQCVIALSGEEASVFLNDLLTAQIVELDQSCARPACLLSPQGRILFDMMVIRWADTIFLITEEHRCDELVKRLLFYRLRRKIEITVRDDLICCHLPSQHLNAICGRDERHNALGWLCLLTTDETIELGDDRCWQKQRIALAIPQGADDLVPNRALMLEAGLDLLGAIDFDKGCYIGQEVTARTHYRGLIKRRLVPIAAPLGKVQTNMDIVLASKIVGRCGSCSEAIDGETEMLSLASLRLDAIKAVCAGDDNLTTSDGTPLKLSIPEWMPPFI